MKREYDGLEALKVTFNNGDFISTSGQCVATILLEMVNGICATDPEYQQIEYVGDKG